MKIPKKHNLLTIIVVLLTICSITPIFYCDSDEYEIGIEENSKVVWEIIDADEDQLEQLLSLTDLDEDDFDYEEEDKIKYEINSISEVSDEEYYVISYDHYENDEDKGTKAERIAMDPEELSEDLEDFELDDYSITFVLTDTEDYIDEVGDKVSDTYKPFIYTSGSSIILNGSVGGFLFWLKMDYDERGILEEMSLVYKGEEIFNMEQKSYTKSNELPLLWLLIVGLIIFSAIIIVVVALVVVLTKRAKKKRVPKAPAPIKPSAYAEPEQLAKIQLVSETETKKGPEKTQYCVNCGTKKEKDATYCVYCGSKF